MTASIALPASGRSNTSQPTGPSRSTRRRVYALAHDSRHLAPGLALPGVGLAGQPEHTLADDVLVHLGGPALDRVRAAAQHARAPRGGATRRRAPSVRARRAPSGAEQVGGEQLEALVEVALSGPSRRCSRHRATSPAERPAAYPLVRQLADALLGVERRESSAAVDGVGAAAALGERARARARCPTRRCGRLRPSPRRRPSDAPTRAWRWRRASRRRRRRCAASSGTRAPSRNTSLKSMSPVRWRSGRTSTPGWCRSTRKYVMPLRFGASGSVRASSTAQSDTCAHVVHTFWPVTTHSSPSRSARVGERREVAARARLAEELAPALLVADDRRQVSAPLLVGAVREQRGRAQVEAERVQPAEVVRSELRLRSAARPHATTSRPPHAAGHVGATRPDRPNTGYHDS